MSPVVRGRPSRPGVPTSWTTAEIRKATPGTIEVEGDHATSRSYTSEVYDNASASPGAIAATMSIDR